MALRCLVLWCGQGSRAREGVQLDVVTGGARGGRAGEEFMLTLPSPMVMYTAVVIDVNSLGQLRVLTY